MPYSAAHDNLTRQIAAEVWPDDTATQAAFWRQIRQESSFDLDVIEGRRDSSSGARGIAQIIPRWHPGVDPLDAPAALRYAARWVRQMADGYGSLRAAMAAYNGGPAYVSDLIEWHGDAWEQYLRDETALYLKVIFLDEVRMTVPRPDITYLEAINPGYLRADGIVPEAIVIHTTDGGDSIEALAAWFQNPAAGVATTYGIGPDGRIFQFAPLDYAPAAHGIVNRPTAEIVRENGNISPNQYAIGIELVDGGQPGNHTAAQLDALVRLCAWLCDVLLLPHAGRTGFTVSRERIIGHYEIDSVNRARCPSWTERTFEAVIEHVNAALRGEYPAPAPEPEPVYTMEAIKLGLITKVVSEEWGALTRDAAKLAGITIQE